MVNPSSSRQLVPIWSFIPLSGLEIKNEALTSLMKEQGIPKRSNSLTVWESVLILQISRPHLEVSNPTPTSVGRASQEIVPDYSKSCLLTSKILSTQTGFSLSVTDLEPESERSVMLMQAFYLRERV